MSKTPISGVNPSGEKAMFHIIDGNPDAGKTPLWSDVIKAATNSERRYR